MQIVDASREKVKLRLGMSGGSGFGKTISSLMIAHGMVKDWSKIGVIDTENKSASLYANHTLPNGYQIGKFKVINLSAPYTPEKYIQAIDLFEKSGIEVLITDSISHEWEGKGGCLEIQGSLGGRYQDWATVTPRHQAFIDKILQSSCHMITTVRRKQDYEMTKENGKVKVEKVGTKEVTRDGFEYELTVNFELFNDKHMVKASKDRTSLFMGTPEFIVTEEIGERLITWCESGVEPSKPQLSEAQLNGAVERIKAGEDLIGKLESTFELLPHQLELLRSAKIN